MRIVVTGASGFIGQYLTPKLIAQGYEVFAISSFPNKISENGEYWIEANLLNNDSMTQAIMDIKPDVLIHLAWYAEHGKFWNASENFAWAHATTQLLEAFRQSGGTKVIIGGTCAEYDWSYGYLIEDETPTHAKSVYGKCKDATRQFAQEFCHKNEIILIWARIFFPYGPGEHHNRLIPSVIQNLIKKEAINCSHGKQYRDFIHVNDVALAISHMVNLKKSDIYNIASGIPLQISSLIQLCTSFFEGEPKINYGAITVDPGEPCMIVGKATKLKLAGWYNSIPIEKGIDQYIRMMMMRFYET